MYLGFSPALNAFIASVYLARAPLGVELARDDVVREIEGEEVRLLSFAAADSSPPAYGPMGLGRS
jgi:hypothetical protein